MSEDIGTGRKARRILTVMAAVFAVAMMIAVPILTAVDTDADFTSADKGYKAELKDPTDEQFKKVKTTRLSVVNQAMDFEMAVFNQSVLSMMTLKAEKLTYTSSMGQKISASEIVSITSFKLKTGEDIEIKYDVIANGSLVSDAASLTKEQKAVAKAIGDYVGNVVVGDKIQITGKLNSEFATNMTSNCKLLDDGKYVDSKDLFSEYYCDDIELTFKLIRDGSTVKEIKLISNVKGLYAEEKKWEYEGDDIKVGTKYTIKYDSSRSYSGDDYFEVDGKKYSFIGEEEDKDDETGTVDYLPSQSGVVIDPYIASIVDGMPASEEGMTVEKTYSAADSAYSDVVFDAIGNDLLKLILIIGGVIIGVLVLIVILIIVLIVLKKKKK